MDINTSSLWVSSKSRRSDFPEKWEDWKFEEHKLRLFQEQIQGWILDVLKEIQTNGIKHSGFAMLAIIMVYFENIQKFKNGYDKEGSSEIMFTEGLKWVYPELSNNNYYEVLLKLIYKECRSGMYHVGLTGTQIVLDCSILYGISIVNGSIKICPSKLVDDVQKHFNKYITELTYRSNQDLRSNFEKRLRFVWSV